MEDRIFISVYVAVNNLVRYKSDFSTRIIFSLHILTCVTKRYFDIMYVVAFNPVRSYIRFDFQNLDS